MRHILALTLSLFLLASCDRPVPPTTPTPVIVTATPDVTLPPDEPTAEPTPTREVLPIDTLDCNTLQVHQDFPPVSPDPCMRGATEVTRLVLSPDGRHQAYPRGFNPTITVGSAGAPFWVNVSSNPRGYRMEITEVNGSFGYETDTVVYLYGTEDNPRRYIVKVGAVLDLGGVGALETVSVSGDVHIDIGSQQVQVDLRAQPMPFTRGYTEWIWIIELDDLTTAQEPTTATFSAQFNIQYADCVGQCFITWQQLAMLEAPLNFGGPADVIDVP